ncbi:hypothetical protein MC885_014871 [Smutsia gigantea]|nr:hypothetical protein MC885_014871 [Smutsia gigantea]
MGPMSAWEPGVQDSPDAFKSGGLRKADCLGDCIYQHLLYIHHFLWSLQSKPSPSDGPAWWWCLEGLCDTMPEGHPESQS